eukprot:TRINITY_DN122187_c0_g1_i1.p1 TRINITY_DN122187_c0_g1~~TRINITY_DN122187_c0_g1_i1.p1  ORF type:complete len:441 (-),score=96.29 TRINITY_DN122187_c0_g1_i1:460-1782(-)
MAIVVALKQHHCRRGAVGSRSKLYTGALLCLALFTGRWAFAGLAFAASSLQLPNGAFGSTGSWGSRTGMWQKDGRPASQLLGVEGHSGVKEALPSQAGKAASSELLWTAVLVALWYFSSCVCNDTSKRLLALDVLGAQVLTWAQLALASLCGAFVLFVLRLTDYQPIANRQQLLATSRVAAFHTIGFVAMNAGMGLMHVSLAMVLRALEPAATLILSSFMVPDQKTSVPQALALLLVCVGAMLSAGGNLTVGAGGLIVIMISNVCFSLRNILGKQVKTDFGTNAVSMFFQMCSLGAVLQAALLYAGSFFGFAAGTPAALLSLNRSAMLTLLLNGCSFYAYLQLSWVCLNRMSAVSHSLANSMRRPATIAAALIVSPVALSSTNLLGIALACAGALAYALQSLSSPKAARLPKAPAAAAVAVAEVNVFRQEADGEAVAAAV